MKTPIRSQFLAFACVFVSLLVVNRAAAEFTLLDITSPNAVRDGRVEAELIPQHSALIPGEAARVGLRLKMDQGWHTYWKNPGDSGLATSIEWELPEGFTAGPILWPAPHYFEVGGLASFGYEGEIVLPVLIHAPDDVEGKSVTLRATADWLVCKTACEAGSASLSLELPLVHHRDKMAVDVGHESLFAQAARDLPVPVEPYIAEASVRDGHYLLSINRPTTPVFNPNNATARFFPEDPLAIEMAAPQEFTSIDDAKILIELIPNPRTPMPAERLRGVVVYQNGDEKFVYQIDPLIRDVADGQ